MQVIALTGASGFLGSHLLDILRHRKDTQIRVLIPKNEVLQMSDRHNILVIEGDLLEPSTLEGFVERGSTVVNLAYLWDQTKEKNIEAMSNLVRACATGGIKRLIHCSTAVVAGRTSDEVVNESTICNPLNDYEKNKLEVERYILRASKDIFEIAILRPTAIFGPGGKNLLKLAEKFEKKQQIY